jgi:hypothetical protein
MLTRLRRVVRPCTLALGLAFAAGGLAPSVLAQEEPRQFMVFEHWGMPNLAGDSRDAGLKKAIEMVPARLAELREEVPGMPPEVVTLLDMVPRMLARPMKMAIAYTPGEPTGGLFNYGIVLSVEAADEAEASKNHERIKNLLKNAQAPMKASERFQGFSEIEVGPPGNLAVGMRKAGNVWRNEVVYGTVTDLDKTLASPPILQKGGKPLLAASFDMSALTPAEKMILTVAPKDQPEIREIAAEMRRAGLVGNDAMKANLEFSVVGDELVSTTRVERAGKYKSALFLSSEPLSDADYKAVPADATIASLATGDLGYLRKAIDQAVKQSPEVGEMLSGFKEATGVDLRTDVIDAVGGSFGYYMSDSTGGGGLGSSIILIGIRDRERFLAAHAKLVGKARELIEQNLSEMPGPYVKIDMWKDGTTEMNALRMRGIPMPIEIAYAVTAKHLVLGVTPQGVAAAVRQINGKGDGGILTNPRVADIVKSHAGKLTALQFNDTPRMVREGYTLLAMLGTGLANGVRSPVDISRDPGLVVPPPHDLLNGSRATVGMTYWDGETMVIESRGDRSILVNAGGAIGSLVQFAPAIGAIGAGAFGAAQGFQGGMNPLGVLPQEVPAAARLLAVIEPWWAGGVVNPGPARTLVLMDDLRRAPTPSLPADWLPMIAK